MKTRDKIVYAGLTLFNEQGERNVTTNHIAAHLDMSPGNLYYHFDNKQEIVRDIFGLYSNELLARFVPIEEQMGSLSMLRHYLDSLFTLMWKYRFFYADLPEILSRDEALHGDYLAVQEKLQTNLINIMRSFVAMDLLRVSDEALKPLITTLHLIATSWLSYQSSMSPNTSITQAIVYQGMAQMISVVKPIATEQGYEQLSLLERGLLVGKESEGQDRKDAEPAQPTAGKPNAL